MKLLLLFVLVFPLSLEPRAASCVCVKEPNPSEAKTKADRRRAFDESVAVFTGEVIALDGFTVKIKLHKRWKGDDAREVILSTGAVPGHDGTPIPKECSYQFRLGEQYLIYAYGAAEKMKADICATSPLKEAAVVAKTVCRADREAVHDGDDLASGRANPDRGQAPDADRALLGSPRGNHAA